jgi:hypothetical protein
MLSPAPGNLLKQAKSIGRCRSNLPPDPVEGIHQHSQRMFIAMYSSLSIYSKYAIYGTRNVWHVNNVM